jgi:tRNA-splicing ligase RtcB
MEAGGKTMTETTYNVMKPDKGAPIKAWTKGVLLEDAARQQLLNVAQLPFIYKWVAAMPDVHWGIGATVGSVIPTRGAIIPAAVGVDMGLPPSVFPSSGFRVCEPHAI